MQNDYMIEKRLRQLDGDLHDRYRNCVVVSNKMLSRYEGIFPEYTDHTMLYTLDIIDYCNCIIGERIDRLTTDDLCSDYVGGLS